MWRIAVILVLISCGPPHEARPPTSTTAPVEEVAVRFARAALAGDHTAASALALTYDEAARLSKKVDRERWDAELHDILAELAREGADEQVTVVSAAVTERRTLTPPRDEKVLREVEVAIVKLHIREADGSEHASSMPWLFIRTAAGWRFSPKK